MIYVLRMNENSSGKKLSSNINITIFLKHLLSYNIIAVYLGMYIVFHLPLYFHRGLRYLLYNFLHMIQSYTVRGYPPP